MTTSVDTRVLMAALRGVCQDAGPSWLREPFALSGWAAASDGRLLAAVRGELPEVQPMPEAKQKFVRPYLADLPFGARQVSLAALVDWAGDGNSLMKCPECLGTSRGNEYVSCTYCLDAGEVYAGNPGIVDGLTINRRLLARGLVVASVLSAADDRVFVESFFPPSTTGERKPLLAVFPESRAWRVVLAQLDGPKEVLNLPAFPEEAAP